MIRARGARITAAIVIAIGCLGAREARAQDRAASAQLLFDEALDLMKKSQFAAACPKLEESQRLDPGLGTQYRLAECYEGTGRLASAWSLFVEVSESARRAGTLDRANDAERRAAALSPRLRRLRIVLSPEAAAAPGLAITRNGEPVSAALLGQPVPVDADTQQVGASATGGLGFTTTLHLNEGATVALTIPALSAAAVAPSDGRSQRIAGVALAAAGVAGIAVGATFGLLARSAWQDALGHCTGGVHDQCDAQGISGASRANAFANVGNVGFIAGGALAAAGVVVYVIAPRAAPTETGATFSVVAGASNVGLRLRGAF
jgi:hypothetical protein